MPARGSGALSERSPLLAYRLCSSSSLEPDQAAPTSRKLSTFLGVVVPTLLSMFSVVLFLRLGFVVGQAGLYQSLVMFLVAYFIIGMTVLSVCAISTNGALDAGGAYYMISRALGPEFGGSIGLMFFFANVCGSALYILGLVEAVVDDFGSPTGFSEAWAHAWVPGGDCAHVREENGRGHKLNLTPMGAYPPDGGACACDSQEECISSGQFLLQRDYSFLKDINIWPPFVIIGVIFSTLSAAMSNLIGASRILYALAKDDLFGKVLGLAKRTSAGGNPWVAVIYSWILVQLVLFSGKLNTIAAVVTIFFLLVYATVDLACLALEWASAPNFRPTFKYFTWHTCVLGIAGCVVMVFLISPIYASASVAFMVILLVALHYLSPSSSWGYISQALIFHQVRKYLLLLDSRKEHVKFWRPQVLLMVRNPRTSLQLIRFINDLKKSGLYVLGHVELKDLDCLPSDPLPDQSDSWLQLVDRLNIKAFVNLTLASSVRHGTQQLLFISGLVLIMKFDELVMRAEMGTVQILLAFEDVVGTASPG
ncbi:LOW QUALITY PROTEIN: solute carrier family 12 member 9-like [Erythrolamprus reginae]|uniref:LOW QUALITY PROTEIN: solute carrier family 12 member 9-like n=1 Tax=Erythrolamprus reginae TaxID=121349 RepID=UPI00396C387D